MKKTFYIKTAFLSLLGMSLLSSCLKDSRYVDFAGSKPLIELPAAAGIGSAGGPVESEAFAIQSTPQSFKVAVNIAAPNPLGSALTVKLGIDQAGLDAYNAVNQGIYTADTTGDAAQGIVPAPFVPYSILPSNAYSSDFTVTIPAGQNLGYVTINVNSSLVDPSGSFILPVKIIDGGGQQISNYNEILYIVQAKNAYDGIYAVNGYVHRDADLSLGGPIKSGVTYALSTLNLTQVSMIQTWADGSVTGGINPLTLTVNATTNAVTITSAANATLENLPGYNSHYDPAKKIFYLGLIWNGTDPTHRSAIDTLTYSNSR